MRTFSACFILAVVLIFSMYGYSAYLADHVAHIAGGYVVAIFVVPSLGGLFFGRLTAGLLASSIERSWRYYWWIIPLGALFANLPSLYYIIFMMFFMEGS